MTERILVICEKPTAAKRIAQALDDEGEPQGFIDRGVPYYVARKGRNDLLLVSALGHLFSIAQRSEEGWIYPIYDYFWAPSYVVEKGKGRTKRFIEVIESLSEGVDGYVSACDYDMEGSLIAYMILLHICGKESLDRAKRMRYSTLTDRELNRGWEEQSDQLDFPLIHAGRSRHEIDWLFGINLSRALTLSLKNTTGLYKTLSIGRVQGPTLNFIKEKEVKIMTFVPTPFWVIKAETRIKRKKIILEYERQRLETQIEAEAVVERCNGKKGIIVSLETEIHKQPSLTPFSLGDLQREAYYKFRYSPRTTLRAAEKLYLEALISYPRTSSQRLPLSIDFKEILRGLQKQRKYSGLASRLFKMSSLKPRQGKKNDPAHPAIHPTGKNPGKLSKVEGKIYDLICRRFMAALDKSATWENTKAKIRVDGDKFYLKGSRLLEPGWIEIYGPYSTEKEIFLPPIKKDDELPPIRIQANRRMTRPQTRFNAGSLLKLMENYSIGTKATRTDIIDTLYKREYIKGKDIRITELGFTIIEALEEIVPEILSVDLTKQLEKNIALIQTGEINANKVVEEALEILRPTLEKFKDKEASVGKMIYDALHMKNKRSTLGRCPSCRTGELKVLINKKTGKRFVGCTNYFEGKCNQSYPLPQKGFIKPTADICPNCGSPIIRILRGNRKPWTLCINVECPGKKEAIVIG